MGMLQGAFLAQYEVLREHGHSPSEAYNETIEEALESLYPLVSQRGMELDKARELFHDRAQRGALDWAPKFHASDQAQVVGRMLPERDSRRRSQAFESTPTPSRIIGISWRRNWK